MCGRYGLFTSVAHATELLAALGRLDGLDTLAAEPRYNACPTDDNPVITQQGDVRRVRMMRWGLIPHWAKDERIGARMINARSETVFDKPAFSSSARRRRCLVPADGFYEWRRLGKEKWPVRFTLGQAPFCMAGIYARKGEVYSYSVLTCRSVAPVDALHDRMPVILDPEDYARWLDPTVDTPDLLTPLLVPHDSLAATPVSRQVNSVHNEGAALWAPAEHPSQDS